MTDHLPLEGCDILLVEDEPLIGLDVALSLEDAGAVVHGPLRNTSDALSAVDSEAPGSHFDGAILDFQLGEETCEQVAVRLNELGVPLVLHTGNLPAAEGLMKRLGVPVVEKPSLAGLLISVLLQHLKK